MDIDSYKSILTLLEILSRYRLRGNNLSEPGDLANELGLILGNQVKNKQALYDEFTSGFWHGLELSECESIEQRLDKFYKP